MKANFQALFKAPLQKYRFFFIYGNDPTIIDRSILFLAKKFSSSVQIKSEADLLAASCSQLSLFQDDRGEGITLVYNVSDKAINALERDSGVFILTSIKARAQSKLVTSFGNHPHALAIAAYASPLLSAEFDALVEGLNIPFPFQKLLFQAYQNDYMGLLATIEKIKLYGEVPEDMYPQFLETHGVEDDHNKIIHSFLLKNQKEALSLLPSLSVVDFIPFVRSLLRSFQVLYELMPFQGSPQNIAWMKLSTPIFFKDQPIYQAALARWNTVAIQEVLQTLLALECHIKRGKGIPSCVQRELLGILRC
jgi:DNA polymerase III delta subunit